MNESRGSLSYSRGLTIEMSDSRLRDRQPATPVCTPLDLGQGGFPSGTPFSPAPSPVASATHGTKKYVGKKFGLGTTVRQFTPSDVMTLDSNPFSQGSDSDEYIGHTFPIGSGTIPIAVQDFNQQQATVAALVEHELNSSCSTSTQDASVRNKIQIMNLKLVATLERESVSRHRLMRYNSWMVYAAGKKKRRRGSISLSSLSSTGISSSSSIRYHQRHRKLQMTALAALERMRNTRIREQFYARWKIWVFMCRSNFDTTRKAYSSPIKKTDLGRPPKPQQPHIVDTTSPVGPFIRTATSESPTRGSPQRVVTDEEVTDRVEQLLRQARLRVAGGGRPPPMSPPVNHHIDFNQNKHPPIAAITAVSQLGRSLAPKYESSLSTSGTRTALIDNAKKYPSKSSSTLSAKYRRATIDNTEEEEHPVFITDVYRARAAASYDPEVLLL